MSSILKALKKLEEESTLQESESQSESQYSEQKIKKRPPVKRQAMSPLMINKYLLLLSALLLGIVGWLIIYSTGKSGLEKKQDNSSPTLSSLSSSSQTPTANHVSSGPEVPGPKNSRSSRPIKVAEPVPPIATNNIVRETKIERGNDDGGLNLTGILWSQITERRLALINDLYLKEGDQVKGAAIIRIEKNEVTLQSGTKTWTISLKK